MRKGDKNIGVLTCAKEMAVDHGFRQIPAWLSRHGMDAVADPGFSKGGGTEMT